MTALTPDDLARVEELAEKATPGAWRVVPVGERADVRTDHGYDARGSAVATAADSDFGALSISDAAFLAAARTAVPALVAGVRSLQARITELETERDTANRLAGQNHAAYLTAIGANIR